VKAALRAAFSLDGIYAVECGVCFWAAGSTGRLRVNGTATVSRQDPLLARTVGAQLIVLVTARAIFPNCPRYIPPRKN
jgi:hypothetical protein